MPMTGFAKLTAAVAVCAAGMLLGCQPRPAATSQPMAALPSPVLTSTELASSGESDSAGPPMAASTASTIASTPVAVPVSRENIISWTVRGVPDETIIDRIDRDGCATRLDANDEIQLHNAGVSDEVLRALKASGR